MSDDSFTRAARKGFGFLVRDWGFEVRASASNIESSVLFSRPDAFVCVMTERSDPWVTVNLGTAASFGLHKKIAKLDPAYAKRKPSGESALIRYYVAFFRKHARAILAGMPRKPPPPEPPRKLRATRAGALDFLTALGWGSGSIREFATKETTLVFHKEDVRIALVLADGKRLTCARISARTKEADIDVAIATIAPDLARPPKDQKARLAYYADFFRGPGAALLEGKRSAWAKLPR